jgi:outer membrane protein assembly factor BamD
MNRLVTRISVVCLGGAIAFAPCAFAKRHKRQKDFNLNKNPLASVHSEQPDKILFDKAMHAMKKNRFEIARLDLQTLLNTYPESEYAMRAKLAVGDTWFKEGGTAALAQAEAEYKDFITFFPNAPEAAEAQMKVGDIYYQQMEKPDRDPQNAEAAEREYRNMLEQFPDSPLIPKAKQKLRDVQEVLAQRQYEIGEFYATREDWAAAIARLQTVADTYPLFSHSDEALITIGDAYAVEAQMMSRTHLPAKAKAEITRYYDNRAAAAWDRVVTHYPLAPHVEDAKDRLIAMGRPVPHPTEQELAEDQAEEESRATVHFGAHTFLQFILRSPSTIKAARVGEPAMTSPPPVLAPQVVNQGRAALDAALSGKPIPSIVPSLNPAEPVNPQVENVPGQASGSSQPASSLTFEEVPDDSSAGSAGNNVSVQMQTSPVAAPASGGAQPLVAPVGPTNNKPLPAIDRPASEPEQINQVPSGQQVGAPVNNAASGKHKRKKKAPYDKHDESSSRHKGKKGLGKLNPF